MILAREEERFFFSFLPALPPPPFTFSFQLICVEYEGIASCLEYLVLKSSNQKIICQVRLKTPSLTPIRNKSSYPPHSELVSTIGSA
jgi:hypothetical protein